MKWARIAAILPVGKLFDRVFAEGIKAAVKESGAKCDRIEPEFASPGKLGAICQKLEGANLILADITARNAHVMFLAGYAQGIGREVLFLAQSGEDFPFDGAKHAPIIYGDDRSFLKSELLAHLCGGGTKKEMQRTKDQGARERFLATFGDLLKKHQHEHHGEIYLENPATYVLVSQDMDLPLVQDLARRGRELGIRIKLM
jgi:hypothetical protein